MEEDAERPDIHLDPVAWNPSIGERGRLVGTCLFQYLRGTVGRRAADPHQRAEDSTGQAEVTQLHVPLRPQEDVLGLDVSVDDLPRVEIGQGRRRLRQNIGCFDLFQFPFETHCFEQIAVLNSLVSSSSPPLLLP